MLKINDVNSSRTEYDLCDMQLIKNNSSINNNTYTIIEIENSGNPYDFQDETNASFSTASQIEQHNIIHKDKKFSCKICKKYYKHKTRLDSHMINFHSSSKDAIKCELCEVKCINEKAYLEHREVHYKKCSFQCLTCDKSFTRKYQLKRHIKQTGCDGSTKDSFPCQVCGHVFARRDNLKDHLRNHVKKGIGKKTYTCDMCSREFKGKKSLIRHIQAHTEGGPFSCSICTKQFKVKASLVKHKRTHTGERPFKCLECGKAFSASEILNRHMKTHWKEKPHVCQECGKSFIQMNQLQAHLIHHTGNKIQCKYCDFTSNRKETVTRHERFQHEGAEKISCTEAGCGKLFVSNRDLKQHLLTHTEKQLMCKICKKYFRTQINLKAHERIHRREVARTCTKCHRAYIRADCLLRHMKAKHPDDYKMLRQLAYQAKIDGLKSKLMLNKEKNAGTSEVRNVLNNKPSSLSNDSNIKYEKKNNLTETQLVSTIRDLLSFMVDKDSLDLFGWPDCSVDEVLNAVLIKFGHNPVNSDTMERVEVLRQNIKLFIVAIIDDDAIDEWIETKPIDEIILDIKQQCGKEDK